MKKGEAEKLVEESTQEGVIKRIRQLGDDVTYYAETDEGQAFTFWRFYRWDSYEIGDRIRYQTLELSEGLFGWGVSHPLGGRVTLLRLETHSVKKSTSSSKGNSKELKEALDGLEVALKSHGGSVKFASPDLKKGRPEIFVKSRHPLEVLLTYLSRKGRKPNLLFGGESFVF